ncbi:hypothetical protein BH02_3794 [Burkholderia pseudomallei]|uniref:hypothetical protein n=1 Tax=Burkholderia pseudomallei TaxID=28450 RepID=UPI0000F29015|nr:hypothetical protein [Burkholderia pseudomallei]ABN88248.1 conserved hypothetical protein [Burkholderia pseudomallei 668]AJX90539.1 hypothetical protein BH02_3794 [Burkholderia pseudomallei]
MNDQQQSRADALTDQIDAAMELAHRWATATYHKGLSKPYEDFDEIRKQLRIALRELAASPVEQPAAATSNEQRSAINEAARVLEQNWEHATADSLREAFSTCSGVRSSRPAAAPADERADAICDSAYCAGLQQGFSFGQMDDNEGLRKALEARAGYVKVLREARAAASPAAEHVLTYETQPDNIGAWRLGEACRAAKAGGDLIDRGLSLLKELQDRGYGIVALTAAPQPAHAEAASPAAEAVPDDCDVRKILLNVVPGMDGEGHEVYAKSVADVEQLLSEMGERLDAFEGAPQPAQADAPAEAREPDQPSEATIDFKGQSVTLSGAQLLEALDFIAPDRDIDREQLESEVTIQYGEGHTGKGLYCWCTEYPEEGAIFLDGSIPTDVSAPADAGEATEPVCWIERDQLANLQDLTSDAWVYWRETGHVAEADEVALYAAPPASRMARLTDEQRESIEHAATWLGRSEDLQNKAHAKRLRALLNGVDHAD